LTGAFNCFMKQEGRDHSVLTCQRICSALRVNLVVRSSHRTRFLDNLWCLGDVQLVEYIPRQKTNGVTLV